MNGEWGLIPINVHYNVHRQAIKELKLHVSFQRLTCDRSSPKIGSTFHYLGPLSAVRADRSVVGADWSKDGGPRQWKAKPINLLQKNLLTFIALSPLTLTLCM